jgi:PAS domain S-box-containing protein
MVDGAQGGADRELESPLVRALVDNLPEMVAYWDANQRCRFANRAYELWFGVPPEKLIGRELRELLGPLYDLNLPYIEGALRGEEQLFERDIPDPRGGPPRSGLAHYVPDVVDGEVRGFCVLVADITKRKRADAAKQALERQAQEAARLSGLSVLAAGVGHELNNPLSVVIASLEQALERVRDDGVDDETKNALVAALAGAARIRDIIRGMTGLSDQAKPDGGPAVPELADAAAPARVRPHGAKRRQLLVVDDEPAITAVLERALGRAYEVTSVNHAREALLLLDREFDVVLCDLMMPEMSGVELHAAVSAERPELADRFVFMTGGAFSARAREFLAKGGRSVVEKPFDFEELIRTLDEVEAS